MVGWGASGPAAEGGLASGFPAPLPLRREELKASSRAVYCDWHFMLTIGNGHLSLEFLKILNKRLFYRHCRVGNFPPPIPAFSPQTQQTGQLLFLRGAGASIPTATCSNSATFP